MMPVKQHMVKYTFFSWTTFTGVGLEHWFTSSGIASDPRSLYANPEAAFPTDVDPCPVRIRIQCIANPDPVCMWPNFQCETKCWYWHFRSKQGTLPLPVPIWIISRRKIYRDFSDNFIFFLFAIVTFLTANFPTQFCTASGSKSAFVMRIDPLAHWIQI
jgi:hypothetical protein